MSNDLNAGFGKIQRAITAVETIGNIIKAMMEKHKNSAEFKDFLNTLNQKDPKHPGINFDNASFYDTAGMGAKDMQALLKKENIPSYAFIDSPKGVEGSIQSEIQQGDLRPTILVVPKQYEKQANVLFSQAQAMQPVSKTNLKENKETVDKLLSNSTNTPARSIEKSMLNGDAATKTFQAGRWMPLAEQLEKASIPHAIVRNENTNETSVIFNKTFSIQADEKDRAIERLRHPLEKNRSEFMRDNCGKEIIEHKALSESQIHEIRKTACGSCVGFNVEPDQNGGYTLRYPANKAKYMTPCVMSAVVRTAANHDNMEAHINNTKNSAENAYNTIQNKQNLTFCDATNPDKIYKVNNEGLSCPDGKFISRGTPKFADIVHSTVMQMNAPVVKALPADSEPQASDVTKEEIMKAKESYAKSRPSEASVMAAQIMNLQATNILSSTNDINQAINDIGVNCLATANAIESENHSLDSGELKEKYNLYGDHVPDRVVEFEKTLQELSSEEKQAVVKSFNWGAGKTSEIKKVTANELSIPEIGKYFDRQEKMPERDGIDRGGKGTISEDEYKLDENGDGTYDWVTSNDGYIGSYQGARTSQDYSDDEMEIGGDV